MPTQTSNGNYPNLQDLTGQAFGRLSVLGFAGRRKAPGKTRIYWLCLCECGNKCSVEASKLKSGHTQSCGCYQSERAAEAKTTHGGASRKGRHRLYRLWRGMLERCSYAKHSGWKYYGGRGIRVCDRWKNFVLFLEDMGESFREGLTVDRKDGNGNYEPSNCVWATRKEQAMNKRRKPVP